MFPLSSTLAQELGLRPSQVDSAIALLNEGATIPFIARYRKERTGELDETQLRQLSERYTYLTELAARQQVILDSIAQQGKLTPELKTQIIACQQKTDLEDLYRPYRPRRRTRATQAREQGLQPLADWIEQQNHPQANPSSLPNQAQKYIASEQGIHTVTEALQGAADILAEAIAEQAQLRAYIRDYLVQQGEFVSKIKTKYAQGTTKFEMYRSYRAKVQRIAPHNLLALYRGEAEGILSVNLDFDLDPLLHTLEARIIKAKVAEIRDFYRTVIADALLRLIKPSLTNEVRARCKATADRESIETFASNLRELLLFSPAGMKPTLGIDPGFRTGCKVVALDPTGQFLEYAAIFPHQAAAQRVKAAQTLRRMLEQHQIELIAIGNGTAGRETDSFVAEVLQDLERKPTKVMVNEAGASIYSASAGAIAEFPDLDITVRGAISIARRLQDPLAELVKLDPKSIGVGQYQHDVDQKLLKQKLQDTVESCVNYVGVDLNTASQELLTYVSGITGAIATNIITYRNQQGAYQNRQQLLKVAQLGPKAFEQAAGFLRIRAGQNPLDNTAVHPESYGLVAAIAQDIQVDLSQITQITQIPQRLKPQDLKKYITDSLGEPTLRDILAELEKPGRDPRAEFKSASFQAGITQLTDLTSGMTLEGVVTNVTNFGAFVDIGVHQDGLVHISQMADRFISDPKEIVKVGQVVKVRVLEINQQLKRIGLSMRSPG